MAPVPPAAAPKSGASACQRAVWQLSVRLKAALTARPLNVPVTTATCGPSKTSMHCCGGPGTGKKIPSPYRSNAAMAAAGCGTVDSGPGVPLAATKRNTCGWAPGDGVTVMERSISLTLDSGPLDGEPPPDGETPLDGEAPLDGEPPPDGKTLLGGDTAGSFGCVVRGEAPGPCGTSGAGAQAASPASRAVQAKEAAPTRNGDVARGVAPARAAGLNTSGAQNRPKFTASSRFCHTNSRRGALLGTMLYAKLLTSRIRREESLP